MSSTVASALALLPVLTVPALWLVDAGFAWVGVVRHSYRVWRAHHERQVIHQEGVNGWLAWATESNLMGEACRLLVKAVLLLLALLRFDVQWARLPLLAPTWDWRDLVQPLLLLVVLLLLTHWSNWEEWHRPKRERAGKGQSP